MRTSNFAKHLRASLENIDGLGAPIDPPVAAAEPVEEIVIDEAEAPVSPEDQLIAADDAGDEVEAIVDETEELEEATAGLEAILLAVSQESAGLDPASARFASLAVEAYTGKWDLGVSLVPSAESFGGTASRREATASLESNVREVLRNAYEYVKELFKKAIEAIINFYHRITDAAEGLEHRAIKLKARAEKLEGKPKNAETAVGPVLARITPDGKSNFNIMSIFGILDHLREAVKSTAEASEQLEHAAGEAITKAFEVPKEGEGIDTALQEAKSAYLGKIKPPSVFKHQINDSQWETDRFPGNIVYVATKNESGLVFNKRALEHQVGEHASLRTRTPDEIRQLADEAVGFANSVKVMKGSLKIEKPESAILASLKDNENIGEANARAISKFIQGAAKDATRARQIVVTMLGDAVSAAAAVVAAGERFAAQYEQTLVEKGSAAAKAAGHKVSDAAKSAGAKVSGAFKKEEGGSEGGAEGGAEPAAA